MKRSAYHRPDEALCRKFHAASLSGKIDIIGRFSSREARILAARVLFRNYPTEMPDRLRTESEACLQRIGRGEQILDYSGNPRRTPQAALAEIRTLRQSAPRDAKQMDLLAGVERYITRQFNLLADEDPA